MKIFLSLLFVLLLCSCDTEINKLDDGKTPFMSITHFEYESHEYINFRGGYNSGVVHNPDCKYCKTKKDEK